MRSDIDVCVIDHVASKLSSFSSVPSDSFVYKRFDIYLCTAVVPVIKITSAVVDYLLSLHSFCLQLKRPGGDVEVRRLRRTWL